MRASMRGAIPRVWAIAPAAALVAGLSVVAAPPPAWSDPPSSPDHLTLLEDLTTAAAQEVVEQLAFPPGTTVHLVAESQHPANWLAQRALAHWLTKSGCQVIVKPSDGQAAAAARPQPAAAPTPQPSRPVGGSQQLQAGGEREGAMGDGSEEPEEADSSATALGDELGEGGQGQGQTGDEGEESSEETEEPPTIVQQRQQEHRQREAEQQAQQIAQAAAPQAGADAGAAALDIERALPPAGEVLLYRVAELEISYPWVKRSWVIGPRRYGRLATVRLRASHLTQPEHQVHGVAQGDRIAIDEFPGWARTYLEGPQYPFPISQPEQKSLQRFVEPVFVVAVVSGLVYLFYENQK